MRNSFIKDNITCRLDNYICRAILLLSDFIAFHGHHWLFCSLGTRLIIYVAHIYPINSISSRLMKLQTRILRINDSSNGYQDNNNA